MANELFAKGREKFLKGEIHWGTDSITHDSLGAYTCSYAPSVGGLYQWEIVCTGGVRRRRSGAFLAT